MSDTTPTARPVSDTRPLSGAAWGSIIGGALLWPLGLVLAAIAIRQTGPTGPKRGRGWAIAGLIVSTLGALIGLGAAGLILGA